MGIPGPKPRDPAPAEIKRACERIREDWDELTYLVRAGCFSTREEAEIFPYWRPPVVATRDLELPLELVG